MIRTVLELYLIYDFLASNICLYIGVNVYTDSQRPFSFPSYHWLSSGVTWRMATVSTGTTHKGRICLFWIRATKRFGSRNLSTNISLFLPIYLFNSLYGRWHVTDGLENWRQDEQAGTILPKKKMFCYFSIQHTSINNYPVGSISSHREFIYLFIFYTCLLLYKSW